MSDYFNLTTPLPDQQLARAEHVNAIFRGIEAGFAKLPSPNALATGRLNYGDATGSRGAYTLNLTPPIGALVEGMVVQFKSNHTNPPPPVTLKVDATARVQLRDYNGDALVAGQILAGAVIPVRYTNGTWRTNLTVTQNVPPDGSIVMAKLGMLPADLREFLQVALRQTGTADSAEGRGLIVGAGGILGNAIEVSNWNTYLRSSIIRSAAGGSVGAPSTSNIWVAVQGMFGTDSGFQLAFATTTGAVMFRTRYLNSWAGWKSLIPIRGSDTNGEWIKFPDGTMICTITMVDLPSIDIAHGSLFRTPSIPWTFPQVFADRPTVSFTPRNGHTFVFAGRGETATTTTSTSCAVFSGFSRTGLHAVVASATGRWF